MFPGCRGRLPCGGWNLVTLGARRQNFAGALFACTNFDYNQRYPTTIVGGLFPCHLFVAGSSVVRRCPTLSVACYLP